VLFEIQKNEQPEGEGSDEQSYLGDFRQENPGHSVSGAVIVD